jgi:hypothetical protein
VAGCVSNDLFREAARRGIELTRVVITADGGYGGQPATSTGITYSAEVEGRSAAADRRSLASYVDEIAEIPNSLRQGRPTAEFRQALDVLDEGDVHDPAGFCRAGRLLRNWLGPGGA